MKKLVVLLFIAGCASRTPAPPADVAASGADAKAARARFVVADKALLHLTAIDGAFDLVGAEVRVDDVKVGTTPFDGSIPGGTRAISVHAQDGRVSFWKGPVTTALAIRFDVREPEHTLTCPDEPPRVGLESPGVTQMSIDPKTIDANIKQRLAHIQSCYESQLPAKPKLHGKIVLNFQIRIDGTVNLARIKSSTMDDPGVHACIAKAFFEMDGFSPRPGPGIITVNYPLLFRSSGTPK